MNTLNKTDMTTVRQLTDAELDAVNGGVLPALVMLYYGVIIGMGAGGAGIGLGAVLAKR